MSGQKELRIIYCSASSRGQNGSNGTVSANAFSC